jgi:hypothetical protein
MILIKDAAVRERCFSVRCDAVYVTVNCPNQCISWYGSSSTKILFRSGVGFLDSNNVYIFIMHKASKVFTLRDGDSFDIDMADLEIWPQRQEVPIWTWIWISVLCHHYNRVTASIVGIQWRANALGYQLHSSNGSQYKKN